MIQILVLGASGMLGSMVVDFLARSNHLSITATVRDEPLLKMGQRILPTVHWRRFDVMQPGVLCLSEIVDGNTWIVNAIGITKPLIRDDNATEVARAIRINSLFPYLLADEAKQAGAQVLQIATDCVYSGFKGGYVENDYHDPLDAYGKTKSLGEVTNQCVHHLRCSIIGPEPKDFKFLLEWFRRQPVGTHLNGYVNHRWNGITTLQFAKIVQGIVLGGLNLPHVQHILPADDLTKGEMLKEFATAYGRHDIRIQDTSAPQLIDRTLSTNNPTLNRELWQAAGYDSPPTVSEMVKEVSQSGYRFAMIGQMGAE